MGRVVRGFISCGLVVALTADVAVVSVHAESKGLGAGTTAAPPSSGTAIKKEPPAKSASTGKGPTQTLVGAPKLPPPATPTTPYVAPPAPLPVPLPPPPTSTKRMTGFQPGKSVEIVEKRDTFSTTFVNPDGSQTTQLASMPVIPRRSGQVAVGGQSCGSRWARPVGDRCERVEGVIRTDDAGWWCHGRDA